MKKPKVTQPGPGRRKTFFERESNKKRLEAERRLAVALRTARARAVEEEGRRRRELADLRRRALSLSLITKLAVITVYAERVETIKKLVEDEEVKLWRDEMEKGGLVPETVTA